MSQRVFVAVAGALQLRPQIRVVEDLAVVGDPPRVVFVGHRLGAGGQIDDAQPAMAEVHPVVFKESAVIGSAVANDLCHAPHYGATETGAAPEIQETGDATHNSGHAGTSVSFPRLGILISSL